MCNSWWTQHKILKRTVSLAATVVFFTCFVLADARAVVGTIDAPYTVSPEGFRKLDVATFVLPTNLGTIRFSHKGTSGKVLIHIQDAHCNYPAQQKISEIIGYLNKEYGIRVVNLEGGAGAYDLSIFTDIFDQEVRSDVADYFVKWGEVNGAEFFALNNPDKVELWGVEDPALYMKNLDVYRNSLTFKDEVDGFLKGLKHIIKNLKMHIFSKGLQQIDKMYGQYKAGEVEFKDYLEYLLEKAKEKGINVKEYPNIYLLSQSLAQEDKINFKKANSERDALIDRLQDILSQRELKEFVASTVLFRNKDIPQSEYYEYLIKKAKQSNIEMDDYPELRNFIVYVSLYDAVDKMVVMEEIEKLETGIKGTMFTNDTQRELDKLSKNLVLTEGIFNFQFTKEDYTYYTENKASFDVANFVSFINKEAPKYKISTRPDKNISQLDGFRNKVFDFYKFSFDRDKAFMKNIRFAGSGGGSSIIVTGGFHTENLCELLREEEISYVSIIPEFRMEEGYESPYFSVLSGKGISPFEQQIGAAMSAIQVASLRNALGIQADGQERVELNRIGILALRAMRELGEGEQIAVVMGDQIIVSGLKNGEPFMTTYPTSESEMSEDSLSVKVRDNWVPLATTEYFRPTAAQLTAAFSELGQDYFIRRAIERGDNKVITDSTGFAEEVQELRAITDGLMAEGLPGKSTGILIGTLNKLSAERRLQVIPGLTSLHPGGRGIYAPEGMNAAALARGIMHEVIGGVYAGSDTFDTGHELATAVMAAIGREDYAAAVAMLQAAERHTLEDGTPVTIWEMDQGQRRQLALRDYAQDVITDEDVGAGVADMMKSAWQAWRAARGNRIDAAWQTWIQERYAEREGTEEADERGFARRVLSKMVANMVTVALLIGIAGQRIGQGVKYAYGPIARLRLRNQLKRLEAKKARFDERVETELPTQIDDFALRIETNRNAIRSAENNLKRWIFDLKDSSESRDREIYVSLNKSLGGELDNYLQGDTQDTTRSDYLNAAENGVRDNFAVLASALLESRTRAGEARGNILIITRNTRLGKTEEEFEFERDRGRETLEDRATIEFYEGYITQVKGWRSDREAAITAYNSVRRSLPESEGSLMRAINTRREIEQDINKVKIALGQTPSAPAATEAPAAETSVAEAPAEAAVDQPRVDVLDVPTAEQLADAARFDVPSTRELLAMSETDLLDMAETLRVRLIEQNIERQILEAQGERQDVNEEIQDLEQQNNVAATNIILNNVNQQFAIMQRLFLAMQENVARRRQSGEEVNEGEVMADTLGDIAIILSQLDVTAREVYGAESSFYELDEEGRSGAIGTVIRDVFDATSGTGRQKVSSPERGNLRARYNQIVADLVEVIPAARDENVPNFDLVGKRMLGTMQFVERLADVYDLAERYDAGQISEAQYDNLLNDRLDLLKRVTFVRESGMSDNALLELARIFHEAGMDDAHTFPALKFAQQLALIIPPVGGTADNPRVSVRVGGGRGIVALMTPGSEAYGTARDSLGRPIVISEERIAESQRLAALALQARDDLIGAREVELGDIEYRINLLTAQLADTVNRGGELQNELNRLHAAINLKRRERGWERPSMEMLTLKNTLGAVVRPGTQRALMTEEEFEKFVSFLTENLTPRTREAFANQFLYVAAAYNEMPPQAKLTNEYHDFQHVMDDVRQVTQGISAMQVDGMPTSSKNVFKALLAALYHDIGYAQEGALTSDHVERSVVLVESSPLIRGAVADRLLTSRDVRDIQIMIAMTSITPLEFEAQEQVRNLRILHTTTNIGITDPFLQMMASYLVIADLTGAATTDLYFAKLTPLYREYVHSYEQSGKSDMFGSALQLMSGTAGFHEVYARSNVLAESLKSLGIDLEVPGYADLTAENVRVFTEASGVFSQEEIDRLQANLDLSRSIQRAYNSLKQGEAATDQDMEAISGEESIDTYIGGYRERGLTMYQEKVNDFKKMIFSLQLLNKVVKGEALTGSEVEAAIALTEDPAFKAEGLMIQIANLGVGVTDANTELRMEQAEDLLIDLEELMGRNTSPAGFGFDWIMGGDLGGAIAVIEADTIQEDATRQTFIDAMAEMYALEGMLDANDIVTRAYIQQRISRVTDRLWDVQKAEYEASGLPLELWAYEASGLALELWDNDSINNIRAIERERVMPILGKMRLMRDEGLEVGQDIEITDMELTELLMAYNQMVTALNELAAAEPKAVDYVNSEKQFMREQINNMAMGNQVIQTFGIESVLAGLPIEYTPEARVTPEMISQIRNAVSENMESIPVVEREKVSRAMDVLEMVGSLTQRPASGFIGSFGKNLEGTLTTKEVGGEVVVTNQAGGVTRATIDRNATMSKQQLLTSLRGLTGRSDSLLTQEQRTGIENMIAQIDASNFTQVKGIGGTPDMMGHFGTNNVLYLDTRIMDNPLGLFHEAGHGFLGLPQDMIRSWQEQDLDADRLMHSYMRGVGQKFRSAQAILVAEMEETMGTRMGRAFVANMSVEDLIQELNRVASQYNLRPATNNRLTDEEMALLRYNDKTGIGKEAEKRGIPMGFARGYGVQDRIDAEGNQRFTNGLKSIREGLRPGLNIYLVRSGNPEMSSQLAAAAKKFRIEDEKLGINSRFFEYSDKASLDRVIAKANAEAAKAPGQHPKISIITADAADFDLFDEKVAPEAGVKLLDDIQGVGEMDVKVHLARAMAVADVMCDDKRKAVDFGWDAQTLKEDRMDSLLLFRSSGMFDGYSGDISFESMTADQLDAFMRDLSNGKIGLKITPINLEEIEEWNASMEEVLQSL